MVEFLGFLNWIVFLCLRLEKNVFIRLENKQLCQDQPVPESAVAHELGAHLRDGYFRSNTGLAYEDSIKKGPVTNYAQQAVKEAESLAVLCVCLFLDASESRFEMLAFVIVYRGVKDSMNRKRSSDCRTKTIRSRRPQIRSKDIGNADVRDTVVAVPLQIYAPPLPQFSSLSRQVHRIM